MTLIGIVSKKNSLLYRASDIKLSMPEVTEAGLGIVPTASTINQLSIGDAWINNEPVYGLNQAFLIEKILIN